MKKIIDLDMDDFAGVLYAKVRGKEPKYSKELKEDPELVISFDSQGSIVGAILLCASELSLNDWMSNPGRTKFPQDLRKALDEWFSSKNTVH